jgi:hypothetical protein
MSGSAWKDLNEKYMRRKEVWEKRQTSSIKTVPQDTKEE